MGTVGSMPSSLETHGPISPPFDFNHPNVSRFSPEVTGRLLINSMCKRLGWPSLAGKRLLDFGCGVRFARTIFNLEIEIGQYVGIDVNAAPIAWLKANVPDARFQFEHLDMRNPMYNPGGQDCGAEALVSMGLAGFDGACMFSVITHQNPLEAGIIFSMLRLCAQRLYFTAFVDDNLGDYAEGAPESLRMRSTFPTFLIRDLLAKTGWHVDSVHGPSPFQQTAFVCSPA